MNAEKDSGKDREGGFYEERQNCDSRLDCSTDGVRVGSGGV